MNLKREVKEAIYTTFNLQKEKIRSLLLYDLHLHGFVLIPWNGLNKLPPAITKETKLMDDIYYCISNYDVETEICCLEINVRQYKLYKVKVKS